VADCGGGTADVITYKVTKTNPMTVQEAVAGEGESKDVSPSFQFLSISNLCNTYTEWTELTPLLGALCGEIFVAERFKELVLKKFEDKVADATRLVTEEEWQEIMTRNWEQEIRNQFTGAAKIWIIRLPYGLINAVGLEPNRGRPTVTITSEEVKEVFEPIVEKIRNLITSQIQAAVKKYKESPKVRSSLRTALAWGLGCSELVC
jgi:hypothetical protein